MHKAYIQTLSAILNSNFSSSRTVKWKIMTTQNDFTDFAQRFLFFRECENGIAHFSLKTFIVLTNGCVCLYVCKSLFFLAQF